MNWLRPTEDGCIVTVKATPRANKSAFAGAEAEWVRVRLQAPPVDGKANAALLKLFAETFGTPKRSIEILTGDTSRLKRIRLHGVSAAAVAARLSSAP